MADREQARIFRQEPWKRLSNEEYAEMIVEQARISAEFEASNRRIRELIIELENDE